MTLRSLETYGFDCSKTKSYRIQRGFFLLFIFLSYPSDCAFQAMPFKPCLMAQPLLSFQTFLSSGSTHWVTPLSFAITPMQSALPKSQIQDPSKQSSRASSSLSPSPVVPDDKCPRAASVLPASLVVELIRPQRAVLAASSVPCILSSLRRFLRSSVYVSKRSLPPPNASYRLGLVLIRRLSSIARLRKVIWIPTRDTNEQRSSPNKQDVGEQELKLQQNDGWCVSRQCDVGKPIPNNR